MFGNFLEWLMKRYGNGQYPPSIIYCIPEVIIMDMIKYQLLHSRSDNYGHDYNIIIWYMPTDFLSQIMLPHANEGIQQFITYIVVCTCTNENGHIISNNTQSSLGSYIPPTHSDVSHTHLDNLHRTVVHAELGLPPEETRLLFNHFNLDVLVRSRVVVHREYSSLFVEPGVVCLAENTGRYQLLQFPLFRRGDSCGSSLGARGVAVIFKGRCEYVGRPTAGSAGVYL